MSFIVAAVIFCEASICSYKERMLVASVIMNRINNPAFGGGKLKNAVDVVKQPLAFSSLHKIQETREWIDANTGGNDIFQRCQELVAHCFPDMLEGFLHCKKDCPHGLGKWLAEDIFENTNLGENK